MANNKLAKLVKPEVLDLWKRTKSVPQPSMGVSVFLNKMHTWTTEGLKDKARHLVRDLFHELFPNEEWPNDKTWLQIGLKVAYRLQVVDWALLGKTYTEPFATKYKMAMEYQSDKQDPLNVDLWQLDGSGPAPATKAKQTGDKPKKGSTKQAITEVLEGLATGDIELLCGQGTKGETRFVNAGPSKVEVKATKNACTYDLKKEYDRNVLFNRIWRWSRKEDIFGE